MDEVAQQPELLLRELHVVIGGTEHQRPRASARSELLEGAGRGLPHLGRGVRGLQVHERAHGLQEAAVAQRERGLRPHRGAVVGEGGEQQPAPPARSSSRPARSTSRRRTSGSPSGAAKARSISGSATAPMRRSASRAVACSPGSPRARTSGPAARASPHLPQRGDGGPPHRGVLVVRAAPSRAGVAFALPMPPERGGRRAAHAPVLVLEGQQRAAAPPGDRRSRPGSPRPPAAGCGRRRAEHADERAHRGRRADRAERLHRGEAQLLARVAQERQQPRHAPPRLRIWPSARRVTKRMRGSGVVEEGQEVRRAAPAPRACPARARPAAAPGCSRRGAPRAAGRAPPAPPSRPAP